jgi:hypothetical protein
MPENPVPSFKEAIKEAHKAMHQLTPEEQNTISQLGSIALEYAIMGNFLALIDFIEKHPEAAETLEVFRDTETTA